MVVAHDSAADLPALAQSLAGELRDGDELVVVDTASRDGSAEVARALPGAPVVLALTANVGFAAGCHAGVAATRAPLVLLLNPDCMVLPGALARLRAVAADRPEWAAWQAAVMLPDGAINSAGGVVHFLGMGWAADCEQPAAELATEPYETSFASGAAMVVRRAAWDATGGLDRSYFLYGEDLDLGLRLRLAGHRVGVEPRALVRHGYRFDKGAQKWFWLERNRWRTVLATYPAPLLLAVLPALLAAEPVLLVLAARQGWLGAKLRAQLAVLRGLPATWRKRRRVQATRRVSAFAFAAALSASLDSPYLAGADRLPLRVLPRAYWAVVCALLARLPQSTPTPATSSTAGAAPTA